MSTQELVYSLLAITDVSVIPKSYFHWHGFSQQWCARRHGEIKHHLQMGSASSEEFLKHKTPLF